MNVPFKKIGIVGWKDKSPDLALALEKVSLCKSKYAEVEFFVLDNLRELAKNIKAIKEDELSKMDLLIAIGGDGTVLSAAHIALGFNIPILGVNAGRVGFLAETRVEDLAQTLDDLYQGNFSTRSRMMIDAQIFRKGETICSHTVLNEVHVRAHAPERMVNVSVSYNDTFLTDYWADSLLVSTPTGSTAYNLAAGGPIIHPSTPAVVLTPVAPSSLSVRPMVLSLTSKKLQMKSAVNGPLDLVFDGRLTIELFPGDMVTLSESKSVTTFIRMQHTGFVGALREKLGWNGKPRQM